ncbi:hypothetical protein D3C86_1400530 [compost metagenome]
MAGHRQGGNLDADSRQVRAHDGSLRLDAAAVGLEVDRRIAVEVAADEVDELPDDGAIGHQVADREGDLGEHERVEAGICGGELDPAHGIPLLVEGADHQVVGALHENLAEARGEGERVRVTAGGLTGTDGSEERGRIQGPGGCAPQADDDRERGSHRGDEDAAPGVGAGESLPAAVAEPRDGADAGRVAPGGVGLPRSRGEALEGFEVVKRSRDRLETVRVPQDELAVGIRDGRALGDSGLDVDEGDGGSRSDVLLDAGLGPAEAEADPPRDMIGGFHGGGPSGHARGRRERARARGQHESQHHRPEDPQEAEAR